MSRDPMAKPCDLPGFAVGKRVWFKDTFDGHRLARQYAERARGMTVAVGPNATGHVTVALDDGTRASIAEGHLRLTPPPSATGKVPKPKTPKPKRRKEAIDPAKGEELLMFGPERA